MGIRRVVTGFDGQGNAIWTHDGDAEAEMGNKAVGSSVTDVWRTYSSPAGMTEEGATKEYTILPPPEGAVFRIAHIPPMELIRQRSDVPVDIDSEDYGMHITPTVDMTLIVSGEIWLKLENNPEEKHLKAGDILVQRGTNHAWRNKSDKECVLCVAMVPAK